MTAVPDPEPSPIPRPVAGAGVAAELLRLADEYRLAALELLAPEAARGGRASVPGRFCALHAIELYLDAFLRVAGESPGRLRAHSHNFGALAALAIQRGLALRRKTALHLVTLTRTRDYLVSRYGPAPAAEVSELNRLTATLEEIARKVEEAVASAPRDAAA